MKKKIITPTLHIVKDKDGFITKKIYAEIHISNVYRSKKSTINGIKMIKTYEEG